MTSLIRKLVIGAFAASTVGAAIVSPLAASAATPPAAAIGQPQTKGAEEMNLAVSDDGYQVMHDVRSARFALFNGDTEQASQLVKQAQQGLAATRKDEKALGSNSKADPNLISIDGQLVLGSDYVPTVEKTAHLTAGKSHLGRGEHTKAIEQLKLAETDIGYTRILMPLNETEKAIQAAADDIANKQYYEANLALKQAEDALSVETVVLVEGPKAQQAALPAQAKGAAPASTAAN